ncbi:hypothetical protein X953_06995 [Virgibacillus sp. SK37]|nr:hypothetical protein X953_06995 [Virgibacillus sp. SK37]
MMQGSSEAKEKTEDYSVYPGLNIKTKTKETDLYTFSVSQPYTEHKQINKVIDEWVDQQKTDFTSEINIMEDFLKKNEFRAHLNIQVETEKIADQIYTLEFEAYQITGGANGMTKVKPFILDLNQNKMLQLGDVLQVKEASIKEIQKLIMKELNSNKEINDYIFEELAKEAIKNPDNWKWSISRDKMGVYFDEYEIAAGAAGRIKVEIPMKKIKPYLNKDFVEKIDITFPEEKNNKEEEKHSEDMVELDPNGKYVALTFDDGPHPKVTPQILATLKKHDAKATFFMLGSQVDYYPTLANEVAEAGHEIGDHTMNHQDLTILGIDQIQAEVQQSNSVIKKAAGRTPNLLRPPYGALNDNVKQIAANMELPIIMWSVDSLDWKSRNATAVNEEVMANVAPGSIVLLHDIHPSTAEALPELLTTLEKQGYQMVTVSQLLELWEDKGVGPHYGNIK